MKNDHSSSQANTKRMLEAFINEVRTGAENRSVISCDSLSKDEREIWRTIRKELQSLGITSEIFSQHQDMIMSALKLALGDGAPEDSSSCTIGNERESDSRSLGGNAEIPSLPLPTNALDVRDLTYWAIESSIPWSLGLPYSSSESIPAHLSLAEIELIMQKTSQEIMDSAN